MAILCLPGLCVGTEKQGLVYPDEGSIAEWPAGAIAGLVVMLVCVIAVLSAIVVRKVRGEYGPPVQGAFPPPPNPYQHIKPAE
jgi:hypothetical protein